MNTDFYRLAVSSHFSNFPKSFSLQKKVPWWYQILNPQSKFVAQWNRTFLYVCIAALFLDPLYFYFPITGDKACMQTDLVLGVFVTFSRTIADLFFLFHMVLKFRTAYIAPTSRVYGRKELVTDPRDIASRYLKHDFIVDLLATLPLPQVFLFFSLICHFMVFDIICFLYAIPDSGLVRDSGGERFHGCSCKPHLVLNCAPSVHS